MAVRVQTRPPRTGQVAVDTVPLLVVGVNGARTAVAISNVGPATVYIGTTPNVTVDTGFALGSGLTLNTDNLCAFYVVAVATGSLVSFLEETA